MWRRTRRVITRVFLSLLALAFAGWTYQGIADRRDMASAPPGRMIDVGGHRLHIRCIGSGTPTVLFDSGLGDTSFAWHLVQPEIATFTQACAYDRAGQGYSDAGPSPRTSGTISEEMAELVRLSIDGAVIAVGQSLGGLNVRLLATRHPDRVAGLVLVDASHEDQGFDMPPLARFFPLACRVGILRILGVSVDPTRNYPATSSRTTTCQSLFDELTHIPESA